MSVSKRLIVPTVGFLALACGGGGTGTPPAARPDQDVRGVYAVTWADDLTIRLDIGGVVQEVTAGTDEVVTFNAPDGTPLELDLAAYCADPAVVCPSEVWPATIAIDQDDPDVLMDLHNVHAWDAASPGAVVDGLVNHTNGDFLFGLDGASGGGGNCAALALSLAGGRFYYPPTAGTGGDTATDDTAPDDTGVGDTDTDDTGTAPLEGGVAWAEGGTTGIVNGRVAVGWLGICAWEGLAVAATLSVETTYEAVRTGPLE